MLDDQSCATSVPGYHGHVADEGLKEGAQKEAVKSSKAAVGAAVAYLPFDEALVHARSLKLKGNKQWRAWCKNGARPDNIPSRPDLVYKDDRWQGFGHWLGTGNIKGGKRASFMPFAEALLYARSLKLKNRQGWHATSGTRPANIPAAPHKFYKDEGWQGYGHWLGYEQHTARTGTAAYQNKQFLPFKDALLHARGLKLKNRTAWEEWCESGARYVIFQKGDLDAVPYVLYGSNI